MSTKIPVLFLKAAMRGDQQTFDLFDTPVTVAPSIRSDGTVVHGYTRVQKKRAVQRTPQPSAPSPDRAKTVGGGKQFSSVAEANKWIESRAKAHGGKRAFYGTQEYRHAYPKIKALYDKTTSDIAEAGNDMMAEAGLQYGDKVYGHTRGMMGLGGHRITGTIISRNGIPHVKLDQKQTVSRGGRLSESATVMWDASFLKVGTDSNPLTDRLDRERKERDERRKAADEADRREQEEYYENYNKKRDQSVASSISGGGHLPVGDLSAIRDGDELYRHSDEGPQQFYARWSPNLLGDNVLYAVDKENLHAPDGDWSSDHSLSGHDPREISRDWTHRPSTATDAPHEGTTKTEGGVTYVLRDGRWHRAEPEAPVFAATHELSDGTPVVAHPDDPGVWVDEHGDEYEATDEVLPIAADQAAPAGTGNLATSSAETRATAEMPTERTEPASAQLVADDVAASTDAADSAGDVAPTADVASDGGNILRKLARARAEKLRGVANKLLESASEAQNRDRQTNTSRRASMAAGAIDRALADEATARTMLRLADAIESGEAKRLDGVSTRAGVDALQTVLRNAMSERDRAETGGSYLEEQRRKVRPADAADLNYVKWPRAQVNDSDRLRLVEELQAKRGGKKVADAVRYGDLTPESWSDIKRLLGEKQANHRVGWYPVEMLARQQRLQRMGINGPDDLRNAMGEFIRFRAGKKAEDPVAVAERALVGQNVGKEYFPTPKPLASRMAELAGIKSGMKVLEPSAGNGNLADAARDAGADVDTIEISHALRTVLEAKKYPIVAHDFDSHEAPESYDAVIMNPPFSQDAEHIQRAYGMLKPGGTLVSIAGEGVFFRSDKRAAGFRSWLEDVGADVEQLPANTFMDKTLQNTTRANARLVVIHKTGEAAAGPREGDTKIEDGIEYVLQGGRWHRVTPEPEPQQDEPAHDPVEHAENKADLAEEMMRDPAGEKAAELAVKVADGVKSERLQMLRDKIEELGGKESAAAAMRQAKKDPLTSPKADKMIADMAQMTGLSKDDVLAEFGLKEREKPTRKPTERKPLAPEGGTEFSDDDPRSPNYRYRDTGYIAGSRKEKAAEAIRQASRDGVQLRATDIDWVEIEANPRLAKELITKSNLFGKVDWEALKEAGMEPAAGFLIDRIYASIAQEPSADDPQARKNFAIGLESIRDRLERCKTPGDVTNALSDIRDEFEGISLNADETSAYNAVQQVISGLSQHYRKLRTEHDQLANVEISLRHEASGLQWQQKKRTDRGWKPDPAIAAQIEALQPQIQEATRKREEWDAANPEYHSESVTEQVDGWTKFRKVGGIEGKMDEAYAIRRAIVDRAKARNKAENPLHQAWQLMGARFQGTINYSRRNGSDAFAKHVTAAKTGKIKDWSWAEKEASAAPKVRKQAVRFQLQVADEHERIGGRPVTIDSTAALKSMFNLRDVQSGNWVLNDPESAAFHTQRCAEALVDLADLVGVPGDVVAMNGRLAMAFGARGSGSKGSKEGAHRAHYEPVERVINLTKMGGGGSLGHEWFHAFDNMVAELEGGKGTTTETFASKNPDVLPPGELRDAFHALRNALTTGTRRLYKRIGYDAKHYRLAKHNLDRPATSLSRMGAKIVGAGDLGAAVDAVRAAYGTVVSNREKKQRDDWLRIAAAWYDGKEGGGEAMIPHGAPVSNLMAEAVRLDQGEHGKYWSQIEELAARSAQAWIEDRLSGKGQRNDYLSAKADNKYYYDPINGQLRPYPEGEERERLNAAFDRLFEAARKHGTLHKAFGLAA